MTELHIYHLSLYQVQKIGVHRDMLMAGNRSLAEHNLSQKPKLERNRQALIEAHQNKALIQEEFDKNRQKLGKFLFNNGFRHALFYTL